MGARVPFWLAAALVAAVGAMFWVLARNAPRPAGPSGPAPSLFAPFAIFRTSGRAGPSPSSTSSPSAASSRCSSTCRSCSPGFTSSPRPTPGRGPRGSPSWPCSAAPLGACCPTGSEPRPSCARPSWPPAGLAIVLAFSYDSMVPLTIACLTLAFAGAGHGRRIQARRPVVPRPGRRRHGRRGRGRRARRLLPAAGHGDRSIPDRELLPGLRAHGGRGSRTAWRSCGRSIDQDRDVTASPRSGDPREPIPARFALWCCIGCGSIENRQPCLGPCDESKLVIVRAVEHDEVLAQAAQARDAVEALTAPVRALASMEPQDDPEQAYRAAAGGRAAHTPLARSE